MSCHDMRVNCHFFQRGQDFAALPCNYAQTAKTLPLWRWPAGSDTQGDLDFIHNVFFDNLWQSYRQDRQNWHLNLFFQVTCESFCNSCVVFFWYLSYLQVFVYLKSCKLIHIFRGRKSKNDLVWLDHSLGMMVIDDDRKVEKLLKIGSATTIDCQDQL